MTELGQLLFGQPRSEHDVPDYVDALFFALWHEMSRVYWNRKQDRFDDDGHTDPEIPGVTVHPYNWSDEEDPRPNFAFGDVEIRWYKHPGRSMTTNREMDPASWVAWFDRCMAVIRATDPLEAP